MPEPYTRIEMLRLSHFFGLSPGDARALPMTVNPWELRMWTVYDHPSDYPDDYVARLHIVGTGGIQPTDRVIVDTLDSIRASMRDYGLTRIERDIEDDPAIVEVWV